MKNSSFLWFTTETKTQNKIKREITSKKKNRKRMYAMHPTY